MVSEHLVRTAAAEGLASLAGRRAPGACHVPCPADRVLRRRSARPSRTGRRPSGRSVLTQTPSRYTYHVGRSSPCRSRGRTTAAGYRSRRYVWSAAGRQTPGCQEVTMRRKASSSSGLRRSLGAAPPVCLIIAWTPWSRSHPVRNAAPLAVRPTLDHVPLHAPPRAHTPSCGAIATDRTSPGRRWPPVRSSLTGDAAPGWTDLSDRPACRARPGRRGSRRSTRRSPACGAR